MRRKIIMAAAMAVLLASSSGCSRSAMTGAQGQYIKDTVPAAQDRWETMKHVLRYVWSRRWDTTLVLLRF